MFYERLMALLKERGLSNKEFLAAIGMSKNQMTNWKNGVEPNFTTKHRIASYFGVTVEYLSGLDSDKEASLQRMRDQEDALLRMFRATTEEGRLRIIQAVMNICDEEEKKSTAEGSDFIA